MALATVTPSEVDSRNEYSSSNRKNEIQTGRKFRKRPSSERGTQKKGTTNYGYKKIKNQRKTNPW
jgi:hypothetical protein